MGETGARSGSKAAKLARADCLSALPKRPNRWQTSRRVLYSTEGGAKVAGWMRMDRVPAVQ
eukprot:1789645-Alexandrium_andersonii.AAC.1